MTNPPRIRWKRFSLRALFVLTTIFCLAAGTWSVYVNPFRLQYHAQGAVARLQGDVTLTEAKGPPWQRWLVATLLGNDRYVHVTKVDLAGRSVDDAALNTLAPLIHLQELRLDYAKISDDGVAALRSMRNLRTLSLRYAAVSDRGVRVLAALPKLNTLHLTGTKITDEAVADLAKLDSLRELYIRWTQLTPTGAERLSAALPECTIYYHALLEHLPN